MLFNEPKLLKHKPHRRLRVPARRFSALQRAEIAETEYMNVEILKFEGFSALQRAEIAETQSRSRLRLQPSCFSALQRAEIAETSPRGSGCRALTAVSVLFNEPKLLKRRFSSTAARRRRRSFSALQRAEIAETPPRRTTHLSSARVSVLFNEPKLLKRARVLACSVAWTSFQCSSTSRNC